MDALEHTERDSKSDIVHQLLCMACLSSGQTLLVLKDEALKLYNMTVNSGGQEQIIHNVSPRVCWECEIQLKKVIHFRDRVTECYNILNSSHVTWSEVTRPSRLQIYSTTLIDIPPNAYITSVDVKKEIKEEFICDFGDPQPYTAPTEMPPLNAVYITSVDVKQEIKVEVECVFEQPCMSCLCGGRTLNGIADKELKFYVDILIQNQVVHDMAAVSPQLCWECCCVLRRATRFSEQIMQCYQTVLPLLMAVDMEVIPSLLSSGVSLPPRLRRCVRDRVDIPPHAHTHNPPSPVKLEKDDPAQEVKKVTRQDSASAQISTKDTKEVPEGKPDAVKYFCCEVCFKVFPRKYSLKIHMRVHTGEQPYQCSECAAKFSMKGSYDRHMLIHSGEKPYQCSLCFKAFNRKSHLICHIKRHSSEKPFQCNQCSKGFPFKANLERHIKTHSGDKPYVCSVCSKAYTQNAFLKVHMRTHTGEKLYQCSVCSNEFCNQRNLDKHMIKHRETPFKCKRCPIAFADAASLDTHVKDHKSEKPFQCSQCLKGFPSKANLERHIRTHTGDKPYVCSHCSKAYTQSSFLTKHIRTHTGEKLYQCSVCSNEFCNQRNLDIHMIKHRETPYKCSVYRCPIAFADAASLDSHVRDHKSEKPFQCSQCSKSFPCKRNLFLHHRIHTGEKPYQCTECLKAFSDKSNLVRHAKTHTLNQNN